MEVRCQVGDLCKRIAVFGRRLIEFKQGKASIGPAEHFSEIPIDNAHAYGGVDTRVPYPPIGSLVEALALAADHPGSYPRNPEGKGYYVLADRFDGIELPNLENPDDLLTDERLIVGDPRHWYRQPVPWSFDWQPMGNFPREVFLGITPRYPAPASELFEVQKGVLPADFERYFIEADAEATTEAQDSERDAYHARFYQEASLGLQLPPLQAGTPISVSGMHPEGKTVSFTVPEPPDLVIDIEGTKESVAPRITNLVVRPAERKLTITYCARTQSLPRIFIPKIHKVIPLSLQVDGGAPVRYQTPAVPRPSAG